MSGLPSIPLYFAEHINRGVDLTLNPKQCCPFHKEDTPSWSYSAERGRWRCFGACHTGGDVIDLHRMNYKLSSREEARKSLMRLYHIKEDDMIAEPVNIRTDVIEQEALYMRVLSLAGTNIDRWVELDYVMSIYPLESYLLEDLVRKWVNEDDTGNERVP